MVFSLQMTTAPPPFRSRLDGATGKPPATGIQRAAAGRQKTPDNQEENSMRSFSITFQERRRVGQKLPFYVATVDGVPAEGIPRSRTRLCP